MALDAAEVIRLLGLKPHREGGHFVETFRDIPVDSARPASTAIYFLLARGERSHWHRVDAAEVWHHYAGAALQLEIASSDRGPLESVTLGSDLASGQRPQGVVPAQRWQAAESLGDWTLCGCTVAPGFDFAGFELAPVGWSPESTSGLPVSEPTGPERQCPLSDLLPCRIEAATPMTQCRRRRRDRHATDQPQAPAGPQSVSFERPTSGQRYCRRQLPSDR